MEAPATRTQAVTKLIIEAGDFPFQNSPELAQTPIPFKDSPPARVLGARQLCSMLWLPQLRRQKLCLETASPVERHVHTAQATRGIKRLAPSVGPNEDWMSEIQACSAPKDGALQSLGSE